MMSCYSSPKSLRQCNSHSSYLQTTAATLLHLRKKKDNVIKTISKTTKCPGEPNSEAISHKVPNLTKGGLRRIHRPSAPRTLCTGNQKLNHSTSSGTKCLCILLFVGSQGGHRLQPKSHVDTSPTVHSTRVRRCEFSTFSPRRVVFGMKEIPKMQGQYAERRQMPPKDG